MRVGELLLRGWFTTVAIIIAIARELGFFSLLLSLVSDVKTWGVFNFLTIKLLGKWGAHEQRGVAQISARGRDKVRMT